MEKLRGPARQIVRPLLVATSLAALIGCNFNLQTIQSKSAAAIAKTKAIASSPTKTIPQPDPTPVVIVNPGTILTPGTGFTGATAQPAQVGSGPAANENVLARWDVVPYQTFDNLFNVGVVAFHINGIDHVDFSVNGGPWTAVNTMALNQQSGVNEYFVTLRASDFADGPLEVRAIAYPKAGVPRVLQGSVGEMYEVTNNDGRMSLILNANAGHTLPSLVRYASANGGSDTTGDGSIQNPFASIRNAMISIQTAQGSGDGGIVYLLPGSYSIQLPWINIETHTRWITVTRAPGVSKSQVILTGMGNNNADANSVGTTTKLFALSGVTLTAPIQGTASLWNVGKISAMWYDDVAAQGTDRLANISPWGINGSQSSNLRFCTNCTLDNMRDGFDSFTIVRNATITRSATGAFRNTGLSLNSTVSDIDRLTDMNIHPDVVQISATLENMILYGITAVDHINAFIRITTYAGSTSKDIAIVDSKFTAISPYLWELGSTNINYYMKNTAFGGGFSQYPDLVAQDVVFENCTFTDPFTPIVPGFTFK